MKIIFKTLILFAVSFNTHAVIHDNKMVNVVHSPDHRPCMFFTLNGVGEADTVKPGNAWFSVPITHHGMKEISSILMSAKLSNETVRVTTTGSLQCGHAEVSRVLLL